jgi:CRP-like cAMP-binding protein
MIQLVGEAMIGEELRVNNVNEFDRLQWQRTETVEQADGSSKKFVEVIVGSNNEATYRVVPADEGCCIRVVVSSKTTRDEVYGRDTPIVTVSRKMFNRHDMESPSMKKLSLDLLTSGGDGRRASRKDNRSTKKIRRRMGISMVDDVVLTKAHDDFDGVEIAHTQTQIDFMSDALSEHFLFTSVTSDTMEKVCKRMKYLQISAGSNIIAQGQNGASFYVVDYGEFEVVMTAEGCDKVKVINTLRSGCCFGESVLMTGSMKRNATVRAVVDCGAWVMHCSIYEEQVLANGAGSPVEEFLKGVNIFYRLTPAVVRSIATKCASIELPANTVIFQQGDRSDDMYFVFKGKVAVIGEDGQELATLKTRDVFGEGAILAGKNRRTATVVTRTVTLLLKLSATIVVKLFPLGLEQMLEQMLVLQVLKTIPGFSQLTEQMLRDCAGVKKGKHLQDVVLRSITVGSGTLVAEEHKPAEAIFIIKRGGLLLTTHRQQKLGMQPHTLSERDHFGSLGACADGNYHKTAVATEENTQVLRLPATHMRMLRDACTVADREELLRRVPLFSTPSARPLLKSLAADSSTATFDEGTAIVGARVGNGQVESNDGDNFYLIQSGFASMYKMDPSTRKMRFSARLGVGDYFGEHVLLEPIAQLSTGQDVGMSTSETVVTNTEVECIILSKSSVDVHMGALRGSMLAELSVMMEGGKVGAGGMLPRGAPS